MTPGTGDITQEEQSYIEKKTSECRINRLDHERDQVQLRERCAFDLNEVQAQINTKKDPLWRVSNTDTAQDASDLPQPSSVQSQRGLPREGAKCFSCYTWRGKRRQAVRCGSWHQRKAKHHAHLAIVGHCVRNCVLRHTQPPIGARCAVLSPSSISIDRLGWMSRDA